MTMDGSPQVDDGTALDLDDALKALANPVRRRILAKLKTPERFFAEQPHPLSLGVCAREIERGCGQAQSTVSAHLAVLAQSGLITPRKIGQFVFYRRNEAAITRLLAALERELGKAESSPADHPDVDIL